MNTLEQAAGIWAEWPNVEGNLHTYHVPGRFLKAWLACLQAQGGAHAMRLTPKPQQAAFKCFHCEGIGLLHAYMRHNAINTTPCYTKRLEWEQEHWCDMT